MRKLPQCDKDPPFHKDISVDPNGQLPLNDCQRFNDLHAKFDSVFNPKIDKYNDASGKIRASINMGPVPPPTQKSRQPLYPRKELVELQEKMDELETKIGYTPLHFFPPPE